MGVFFPIIYDIRGMMYDVLYLPRFFFLLGMWIGHVTPC